MSKHEQALHTMIRQRTYKQHMSAYCKLAPVEPGAGQFTHDLLLHPRLFF